MQLLLRQRLVEYFMDSVGTRALLEYLDLKRSKNDQNRLLDGVLNQSS